MQNEEFKSPTCLDATAYIQFRPFGVPECQMCGRLPSWRKAGHEKERKETKGNESIKNNGKELAKNGRTLAIGLVRRRRFGLIIGNK